jgi:hypothetical protein
LYYAQAAILFALLARLRTNQNVKLGKLSKTSAKTTVLSAKIRRRRIKLMSDNQVRVRSWEEFKRLVSEKKPGSIVFVLEQNGFSPDKELSTLRVLMLHDKRYYIFLDFPKGETLRETGIPLHKDKKGNLNLDEDEVKEILKKQFEKEKLNVFSFWTT